MGPAVRQRERRHQRRIAARAGHALLPGRRSAGATRLRGNRDFARFWAASSISLAGTLVTAVVLPVLIYQLTGSPWQTSLLAAIETVPYLAFGLVAGAVADRVDRRRLMWRCELASAGLLASIPVASAAGVLTIAQIYAVALGVATVFVWFDAATFGALPAITGRDQLASAYARMSSSGSVLQMTAPALGGVLIATIGAAASLSIDSASCTISAALLISIRRPFASALPGAAAPAARLRQRIAEGLRFLWHEPTIRALTLLGFGNSATLGAMIGLLVVDAHQQLGLSRTSALIGVLFAAGAAGALAASLGVTRLMRAFPVRAIAAVGLAAQIVLVVLFALCTNPWPAMAAYLALNAASQAVILSGIIYRQQVTPDELQGRVNVVARMIAWGGQPFGAVAAGAVAEAVSIRAGLLAGGAGVAVSLALCLIGSLRIRGQARLPAGPAVPGP